MKNTPEYSEKQTIEQLQAGSKEAFRYFFDSFGPRIHAFALSYLKNETDAEELLQEVFLKLWETRAELDSSRNIKSFLFKICINLVYDFIRRKNIELAYLDYSGQHSPSSTDRTWHEVIYNDMLAHLESLVEAMPEQRRQIFRLSKEEGLTNDEIARQLNLSKRTVENQLYRAVAFLKVKLGSSSLPGLLIFYIYGLV